MTLVIHAGPHKTATTYIQANLTKNRAALAAAGWAYPAIGERTGVAHHDVSDNLPDILAGAGPVVDDLRRVFASGAPNVLLSSEGFRRLRPHHYAALRAIAAPHDLRVVYALRDPHAVIRSMWGQRVLLGDSGGLDEWLARQQARGRRSRFLNPLIEIEANMKSGVAYDILLYDEIRRRGLDIFSVMVEGVLGVSGVAPEPGLQPNESQPVEIVEFVRLVTLRHPDWAADALHPGETVRFLLNDADRAEIVETVRAHGGAARRTIEIVRDTPWRAALEARLRERLEPLMRPAHAGRLFPTHAETWTHYDAETLVAAPAVAALVGRMERKMTRGPQRALADEAKRMLVRGRRLRKRIEAVFG